MAGDRDKNIWDNSESYPYTYHDRLFNYKPVNIEDKPYMNDISDDLIKSFSGIPGANQIEAIISKLKESPYTRRAQAITWRPLSDPQRDDPPCLQRMWFRIHDGKLRMNTHFCKRELEKVE